MGQSGRSVTDRRHPIGDLETLAGIGEAPRCVVVSYNEEGLLSREEIGAILARFSGVRSFDFRENLREINFPRFRSDSDRPPGTGRVSRAYRVVDGKEQDRVGELLFFARRDGPGRKKSGRRRQERLQWS